MLAIHGVYEVAIRVKDLARAEAFYRDVLGLEVGLRDERRPWLFLRAGGQAGILLLQEDKGEWPTQHLAFTVRGPVFHAWMPATSVYFADPDGHQLELCAPTHKP